MFAKSHMTVVTNRHPKCNRLMMNIYQKNKSFQIKKTFKSPAMLKTYMSALYMPSHWLRALLFWDRDVWLAGLRAAVLMHDHHAKLASLLLIINRKPRGWGWCNFFISILLGQTNLLISNSFLSNKHKYFRPAHKKLLFFCILRDYTRFR